MSLHWWQGPCQPLDHVARAKAEARQQQLTKPAGSLGRLEALAIQLAALTAQATAPDGQLGTITQQQQEAIANFNDTIVDVRRELRDVQGALRQDIDALANRLRLINIVAAPAISHFIVSIESVGLSDRPPESNVTPLPTIAKTGASAAAPR